MNIRWNIAKDAWLRIVRGVSFEEIVGSTFLGIEDHPRRQGQFMMIFEYEGYVWVVPFILEPGGVFLKTVYPSRKHRGKYEKRSV